MLKQPRTGDSSAVLRCSNTACIVTLARPLPCPSRFIPAEWPRREMDLIPDPHHHHFFEKWMPSAWPKSIRFKMPPFLAHSSIIRPPPILCTLHRLSPSPVLTISMGFVNAIKEQLGTLFREITQDCFHPYPHRDHVADKSRDHGAIAG